MSKILQIPMKSSINTFSNPFDIGMNADVDSLNIDYSREGVMRRMLGCYQLTTIPVEWDIIFMEGFFTKEDPSGMKFILVARHPDETFYSIYEGDRNLSGINKISTGYDIGDPYNIVGGLKQFSGDHNIISNRFRLNVGRHRKPYIYQYINRNYLDNIITYRGFHFDESHPKNNFITKVNDQTPVASSGGNLGNKHYFWKIAPVYDGNQEAPLPVEFIHRDFTGTGTTTGMQVLSWKIDKNNFNPRVSHFNVYRSENDTEDERDLTYLKVKSIGADFPVGDIEKNAETSIGRFFLGGPVLGYGDDYSGIKTDIDDTGHFAYIDTEDATGDWIHDQQRGFAWRTQKDEDVEDLVENNLEACRKNFFHFRHDGNPDEIEYEDYEQMRDQYDHVFDITGVSDESNQFDYLTLSRQIPVDSSSNGNPMRSHYIVSRQSLVNNGWCAKESLYSATNQNWFKCNGGSSKIDVNYLDRYLEWFMEPCDETWGASCPGMGFGQYGFAQNLKYDWTGESPGASYDAAKHGSLTVGEKYLVSGKIYFRRIDAGQESADHHARIWMGIAKGKINGHDDFSFDGETANASQFPSESSESWIAKEHIKVNQSANVKKWLNFSFVVEIPETGKHLIALTTSNWDDTNTGAIHEEHSKSCIIKDVNVNKIVKDGLYHCGQGNFVIDNDNTAIADNTYAGGKVVMPNEEVKLIGTNINNLFKLSESTIFNETDFGPQTISLRLGSTCEDEPTNTANDNYTGTVKIDWTDIGSAATGTHDYQDTSIDTQFEHSIILGGRQFVGNVQIKNTDATSVEQLNNTVIFSELNKYDILPVTNYITLNDPQGGSITGLANLMGDLVVFMENSIWRINVPNYDPSQWTIIEVSKLKGCRAKESILSWEGGVFFANAEGWYFIDPNFNITEISAAIRLDYQSVYDDSAKLEIDLVDKVLYLFVKNVNSYTLNLKEFSNGQISISSRSIGFNPIVFGNDEFGKLYAVKNGTNQSILYKLTEDSSLQNQSNTPFLRQTGIQQISEDGETPAIIKEVRMKWSAIKYETSHVEIQLTLFDENNHALWSGNPTHKGDGKIETAIFRNINAKANYISFKYISYLNFDSVDIYSTEIIYE